jgi:hypothetical protein
MRRYVVAGVVQGLAAALVCFIVLASVLDGSSTSESADTIPSSLIVLSAASAASAVLAFLSRSHVGPRLPFLLVELAWTALYGLPLGAALVNASQSAGVAPYQGKDPMLGIALALSSAASSAGGAVRHRVACLRAHIAPGLFGSGSLGPCADAFSGAPRWR